MSWAQAAQSQTGTCLRSHLSAHAVSFVSIHWDDAVTEIYKHLLVAAENYFFLHVLSKTDDFISVRKSVFVWS